MSTETLREIIEEAASALNRYQNPHVSECQDRLNEIIVAAKLGGISHDHITSIDISRGMVSIYTKYSIRSCPQEDLYEFPEHIIDADDPVKAATIWGLETKLEEERQELKQARRNLNLHTKRVEAAERSLAAAAAN
jgi:hypothetical protein